MPVENNIFFSLEIERRRRVFFSKRARLASSQQSSMARTLSRRSGLKDDCGFVQCKSEPPGKMESRALGRTDNRDCLGARYDILKEKKKDLPHVL